MIKKNLRYNRKYLEKSDSDWKDSDCYYEFIYNDSDATVSYKATKLLNAVPFKKGELYDIDFGDKLYPISVSFKTGKVFIRNKNSIISVNSKGKETNLSGESINMKLWKIKREQIKKNKKESDNKE